MGRGRAFSLGTPCKGIPVEGSNVFIPPIKGRFSLLLLSLLLVLLLLLSISFRFKERTFSGGATKPVAFVDDAVVFGRLFSPPCGDVVGWVVV